MSEPISTETDIEQLKRDLTALKTDVAALVGHLKSTATAGIEGVIDQADLGAQTLYRNANAEGERAVKAGREARLVEGLKDVPGAIEALQQAIRSHVQHG